MDYYNAAYARSIAFGGVLIVFLGFLFLYHALIRDFHFWIVILALISVYLGTNLFHYTTREMSISHSYTFFLFAFLLWFLPRYFNRPDIWHSTLFGLIIGLIILIRPTNILVATFVLGYEVYTWPALKHRLKFFLKNLKSLGIAAFCAVLIWLPQFWYWHEMSGHWLFYSYTEEKFLYWKSPKILEVWFDVQNGLFLYSPLVMLMIIGLAIGLRKRKYHAPVLSFIFLAASYLFASWWRWNFGGAFGHRCYVEYYAWLIVPLCGLYQSVLSGSATTVSISTLKVIKKTAFLILILGLIIYSVRLSYLNMSLPGPWDGEDWQWNWEKYSWIMDHFFE